MFSFTDENVYALYMTVRCDAEPMINDTQREAVHLLGTLAHKGNADALAALHNLVCTPNLHPLLAEMVRERLVVPQPV